MAGQKPYRMLDHTSDIGFEVRAGTLAGLYENAAFALFDQIADLESVEPARKMQVSVQADAPDDLMHAWLSELLYLFEVKSMVFRSFRVEAVSRTSLSAVASGEPFNPDRHAVKSIVKAVTRHMLEVSADGPGWKAVVLCDV